MRMCGEVDYTIVSLWINHSLLHFPPGILGLYGIIRTKQPLRVGLLAGQALERSDNPAIIRRTRQPHRVGLSKVSTDGHWLIFERPTLRGWH